MNVFGLRPGLAVITVVSVALAGTLLAQVQNSRFEVASVKASADLTATPKRTVSATRLQYRNFSLKALMTDAFGIERYQISGPAWLRQNRYDVSALIPAGTSAALRAIMLQQFLKERFSLEFHNQVRNFPAYVLMVAEGGESKIRAHAEKPGCKGETLEDDLIPAIQETENAPVVNQTGLSGRFYLTVAWRMGLEPSSPGESGRAAPPPPPPPPPVRPGAARVCSELPPAVPMSDLFTALKEQLGLKLVRRGSASVNVLVIDRINKVPTEN